MAQVYMHCNYFERNWPLEYGFARAKEYGYDGIEARMPSDDSLREGLKELKGLSEMHELGVTVGTGCSVVGSNARQRRKATADMIKRLRATDKVFGEGTIINTSTGGIRDGSATADEVHYERAAEAYRHIAACATELGLQLVFEIHMGTLHDTAHSTAKLLKMIGSPAVKANLDFGNMFLTPHAEQDPREFVPKLKGKIGHLHVKNYHIPTGTQARFLTLLAEGDIDHSLLLKCVKDAGYKGIICPEHPWPGDGHYSAPRDLQYLRETTARLGW